MNKRRLPIDKIKELKKYHTNQQVYNILNNQGIAISLSYIEKIKIDKRIITNNCEQCGKIFYYMRYKKLCLECSGYYNNLNKIEIQKTKDKKFHKELKERMKETTKQTGLTENKINKLLQIMCHSDIRKKFNIKNKPCYKK